VAFSDCLQALQSLEKLTLRRGMAIAWTLTSFLAVAKHPSLKSLVLPATPSSWLRGLENNLERRFFRNVEDFTAGLSEDGLKSLLPCLTETKSLEIYLTEPSSQALKVCSVPNLRSLILRFKARSVVRARDLILFAETCISLKSLEVSSFYVNDILSADRITDATMDQVARLLPNLESLQFDVADTSLTEASLLSLGSFCKRLKTCRLHGCFFFQELVRSAPVDLFPALHSLSFQQPAFDHRPVNHRLYRDPEDTAKRVLQVAPCLRFLAFDLSTATNGENALRIAVFQLARVARGE